MCTACVFLMSGTFVFFYLQDVGWIDGSVHGELPCCLKHLCAQISRYTHVFFFCLIVCCMCHGLSLEGALQNLIIIIKMIVHNMLCITLVCILWR